MAVFYAFEGHFSVRATAFYVDVGLYMQPAWRSQNTPSVKALLEVLRYRALQIDVYLLTYLIESNRKERFLLLDGCILCVWRPLQWEHLWNHVCWHKVPQGTCVCYTQVYNRMANWKQKGIFITWPEDKTPSRVCLLAKPPRHLGGGLTVGKWYNA